MQGWFLLFLSVAQFVQSHSLWCFLYPTWFPSLSKGASLALGSCSKYLYLHQLKSRWHLVAVGKQKHQLNSLFLVSPYRPINTKSSQQTQFPFCCLVCCRSFPRAQCACAVKKHHESSICTCSLYQFSLKASRKMKSSWTANRRL